MFRETSTKVVMTCVLVGVPTEPFLGNHIGPLWSRRSNRTNSCHCKSPKFTLCFTQISPELSP